jgi:hypothetical protein
MMQSNNVRTPMSSDYLRALQARQLQSVFGDPNNQNVARTQPVGDMGPVPSRPMEPSVRMGQPMMKKGGTVKKPAATKAKAKPAAKAKAPMKAKPAVKAKPKMAMKAKPKAKR